MARRQIEAAPLNMTPMIDVVFQLLIFFVLTADFENFSLSNLFLPDAPHGQEAVQKDPRTVFVDVSANGKMSISGIQVSLPQLTAILKKVYVQQGNAFPVVIRGDKECKHEFIKNVMDASQEAGFSKIRFAAIKKRK
jgi:biopolymer transport protein ExbD